MIKIGPTTASAYHRSGIRDGNPTPELSALENSAEKVIKKGKITGQERLALPGPDHKTISVEKTSVLWSHSRLMALSVPGPVSYTHLDVYKRQDKENFYFVFPRTIIFKI